MRQMSLSDFAPLSSSIEQEVVTPAIIATKQKNNYSIKDTVVSKKPTSADQNTTSAGALSELRIVSNSPLQPSLLFPLLTSGSIDKRWLVWFSSKPTATKSWIQNELKHYPLLADLPIMHVNSPEHVLMSWCRKAIRSGNHHILIEWRGVLTDEDREILQKEALHSGTQVILIIRES